MFSLIYLHPLILLTLLFPPLISSQTIYIDRGTNYSLLPCCAQVPLSLLIRDQRQGCGDGGHLTSYDCFCSTSSSHFRSLISSDVSTQCAGNSTVASDAVGVFDTYCAVGRNGTQRGITTAPTAGKISCPTSTIIGSPSPARSTPSFPVPLQTSNPTASGPPPANTSSKSDGAKIKRSREMIVWSIGVFLVAMMHA